MGTSQASVRAFFAVVVLQTALASTAYPQIVELMSTADGGALSDTPGGDSTPRGTSDDGRYVVFESDGINVVPAQIDTNPGPDIFLYDRITDTTTLVSHTPGSPATTGNWPSSLPSISGDGEFVFFQSEATDLVVGQVDGNGSNDMFWFERATGMVTLVSHQPGSTVTTGDAGSNPFLFPAPVTSRVSFDGSHAVYVSWASDLVVGQVDINGSADVFLYDRGSGTSSLVSHVPAAMTTAANASSYSPRISADGEYVAFTSGSTDLVPGQTEFAGEDVFLFQRATGTVSLVSHIPASLVTTADSDSYGPQISADGSWVAFISVGSNLVVGQTDLNFGDDLFLFERATGTVSLVSHIPASNTTAGDTFAGLFSFAQELALSPSGEFVAFLSNATNLVTGQVDGNGGRDVFRYEHTGGTVELVSATPGSTTNTASAESTEVAMSGDGELIVFLSAATDLVAGQVDTNSVHDVFVRDRGTGTTSLATHAFGLPATAGNNISENALISVDGGFATFASLSSDLVGGLADLNERRDTFLYEVAPGTNSIVSRADVGSPTGSANGGSGTDSDRDGMSADGRYTLFKSSARNLVAGQIDNNNASDLFLYDRVSQIVALVSHAAGAPNVTADRFSSNASISNDGRWVVFQTGATNVVPGQIDGNGTTDVFLYERATGNLTLVSHLPALPTTTASGISSNPWVSADGSWVSFSSTAPDLIAGDANGQSDVFLYQRTTGNVTLVSHIPGAPTTPANAASADNHVSFDGNWVAFASRASNLVAGQLDGNGGDDVFLFHRLSGVIVLASHTAASPTTTGNGISTRPKVSLDGSFVGYRSGATNLAVGQADANGVDDLFLFDRVATTSSIVSHRAAAPLTTGNATSLFFAMSDDASYIAYMSRASDLVTGQIAFGADDIFIYERATTANSLASHLAGTVATEANAGSDTPVISGDGNWVAFRSSATNLALGQVDTNVSPDAFLHDRITGTTSVLSLKAATVATTGDRFADGAVLGGGGDYAAFRSHATDLVTNDFNGNGDAFLYTRTTQTTDLSVMKDDGQTTAVSGEPISYVITVTNNGPTAVTSLTLMDTVPPEITSPVFTPSAGVYNSGSGLWSGIALAPLASITMTLDGNIDPLARGILDNTVTVSTPSPIVDPLPNNNTAIDSNTLTPEADLEIIKSDSPDPVDSGSTLSYTLSVTNNGPSEATNIVITDVLPPVTFVSAFPGAPTCNYLTGTVTCDMGSLQPTFSTFVTIDVIANFAGLSNAANVTADEFDPDESNNIDSEGTVVNIPTDAVRFFTAKATLGQNRLEWINPAPADYLATHIVANTTGFPANETDGAVIVNGGTPGAKEMFDHTGLTDDVTVYYGAFVERVSGFSAGKFTTGRPFNDSGPVKWAFTTGAATMAPPSLGSVYASSNDKVLYAMTPGPTGGDWLAGWTPFEAPEPAQQRPPIVPVTIGAATKVAFLGAQDGHVYAVNANTGAMVWPSPMLGDMVQAAPAGMFMMFGGNYDLILVGSRSAGADNTFYGLDLATGAVRWTFDNLSGTGGVGIINGGASVDYANDRLYFASRERSGGSSSTVWCIDFDAGSATILWERGLGDIDGSPIRRDNVIYVGTNTSKVHALDADDGSDLWSTPYDADDGPIKGFIWPKGGDKELYFSTNDSVWSISDDGADASLNWEEDTIDAPSTPLFFQGVDLLFVGSSDGRFYQLDVSGGPPVITSVALGNGAGAAGSPSLDGARDIVYIGTDAGILYAIEIPLP